MVKSGSLHNAGHGITEGWWKGGKDEPTYTWRSNILPLAHTDRQRSHPAATSAFCRTPPAANAAAGSGG